MPSLNNNFYIRNQNTKIRTFEIAKDVVIEGLDGSDLKVISYEDFKSFISDKIFNIEYSGLIINKISEQYRP